MLRRIGAILAGILAFLVPYRILFLTETANGAPLGPGGGPTKSVVHLICFVAGALLAGGTAKSIDQQSQADYALAIGLFALLAAASGAVKRWDRGAAAEWDMVLVMLLFFIPLWLGGSLALRRRRS